MFLYTVIHIATLVLISVQALPAAIDVFTPIITHWGSGCPQDTTNFAVTISPDSTQITASFPSFAVKLTPISESTEFCGIGVDFGASSGKQYAVVSTNYRDEINVGKDETATHLLSYTFSSSDSLATTRRDYKGPVKGGFDCTDTVPSDQRIWSECGDPLELLITNRGFVTDGGADAVAAAGISYFNTGSVVTNLVWRSC